MITISKIESTALDPDVLEFAPIECMSCEFDGAITSQYFVATPDIETEDGASFFLVDIES